MGIFTWKFALAVDQIGFASILASIILAALAKIMKEICRRFPRVTSFTAMESLEMIKIPMIYKSIGSVLHAGQWRSS